MSPNAPRAHDPTAEWLETDGLGGFASGTVTGIRTRRYHALLLVATTPPTGRRVLVNGFDAEVTTAAGTFAISSQRYSPDVTHPDGCTRLESFTLDPWPTWMYQVGESTRVIQEVFVPEGIPAVALRWRLHQPARGVTVRVRPFLSGRDAHGTMRENSGFRFAAERRGGAWIWRPYEGVPGIVALANGEFAESAEWYRNFQYDAERARGLDFLEDLAMPGEFTFDLSAGAATLIFTTEAGLEHSRGDRQAADAWYERLRAAEKLRRAAFPSRLARAADCYIVRRGAGRTIVAGYPWFTDWGRDTFIALRGLCLANGRLEDARAILMEWSGAVSQGMLPNRYDDGDGHPEFNAVDASLWYVVAAGEFLKAWEAAGHKAGSAEHRALRGACDAILEGYAAGTRHRIHLDDDGLLAAGEPGVQLTWMDARVGDWVVTPRIGKPVEVQALWLNALRTASTWTERWSGPLARGLAAFEPRFWNAGGGYLFDVVDVDHVPGAVDAAFRPNQLFAIGGLPHAVLKGERARRVVDACERRLLTPLGPRSLAPGEPGYVAHFAGGVLERDGAYHNGTVWPWLMGAFVEAWVRVRGGGTDARAGARRKFLEPWLAQMDTAGLGHLCEVADAEAPFTPGGCPFQAWSVGEALRLERLLGRR